MSFKSFVMAAVACSMLSLASAQPPPAEAYGRLPAIGSASISPDGKRVAISVGGEFKADDPNRDLTAVRIINIDTGTVEHTLAPPASNTVRGVSWADDTRPMYVLSEAANLTDAMSDRTVVMMRGDRVEFLRTGVFSLEKRVSTLLMDAPAYRMNDNLTRLVAPIEGDPGFGRMIAWGSVQGINAAPRLTVFRVNLDNGAAIPQDGGNAQTRGYMLNERGEIAARLDINDRSDRWRLYWYENGKDRLILEDKSEMGQPLQIYGRLPDGRIVAVDPHEGGSRDTLLAIDTKTGAKTSLHSANGNDVWPIGDPWLRRVVGVGWLEDLPKQLFFDAQLQALAQEVQQYFDSGYATILSWSRDRSRVLIFGERAGDAGAYYVYEPAAKKVRALGKQYPALTTPESLGDRRSIRYPARDGKAIPAYLTLPAGVPPKKLPLVLLVHGGPHARDDFKFNWWASFLASRGYAVLQPNYRGSTGYGYEWFDAGRGGWGDGLMQTDVEDGVAALVKDGTVDGSRVCIMGASYGGYAALAGAIVTPDRYTCAVSVNGVSDPERMLNAARSGTAGKRGMAAEWWGKSMGEDMDHLRKVSPIQNADRARIPILIMHGDDDSVVPVEQSRLMNARLLRADKKVKYVELKGDDHWLSSAAMRTQMLREIESFLAEQLGGAKPAPATAAAN